MRSKMQTCHAEEATLALEVYLLKMSQLCTPVCWAGIELRTDKVKDADVPAAVHKYVARPQVTMQAASSMHDLDGRPHSTLHACHNLGALCVHTLASSSQDDGWIEGVCPQAMVNQSRHTAAGCELRALKHADLIAEGVLSAMYLQIEYFQMAGQVLVQHLQYSVCRQLDAGAWADTRPEGQQDQVHVIWSGAASIQHGCMGGQERQ